MAVIQSIRTAVFYLLFIGQTAILAILIALVGRIAGGRSKLGWALAHYWCWSNVILLRFIAGVKTQMTGEENIPAGGCIIAAKHQSDWDVFAIFPHTHRPAYVVKKELMDIPFFGWAARSLDCIAVDRKKGAEAIPLMMAQAHDAADRGCRIVIFPEGTRKAPLAPADYRQGIVRLYLELKVPVVPVALNSGLYWGRNSLLIWPGTAQGRFLPPIEPGLTAAAFMERLKSAIETQSDALILDAVDKGLGRSLTPEFQARVEERRKTTGHTA
ncbi:MAG: lysophospholipid acyltransferase family protein [Candidatus Devosia phytovorans]|uniref:Lysophospholipid acyltransferase family protein n=1 Tax=Candidatus Devosia phytovorans TaxID=3121372 RepID=A0AAJ5VW29_9HYPH|nr:lysophospholipid acyltransferase family protein [Devosia sp.]WEK04473.1 MAG: lysophospholipid acyltransferase family protein [Devosia sp.]